MGVTDDVPSGLSVASVHVTMNTDGTDRPRTRSCGEQLPGSCSLSSFTVVPVVAERTAADADSAVAAAEELGFPVVVKTAAAGAHKTESGGVALNLADGRAVRAAAERIGGRVIVQAMVRGAAIVRDELAKA